MVKPFKIIEVVGREYLVQIAPSCPGCDGYYVAVTAWVGEFDFNSQLGPFDTYENALEALDDDKGVKMLVVDVESMVCRFLN